MILLLELPENQSYRDLAALAGSDYGSRIKEKMRRACCENGRFSNKSWVAVASGLGERKAKGTYLTGLLPNYLKRRDLSDVAKGRDGAKSEALIDYSLVRQLLD